MSNGCIACVIRREIDRFTSLGETKTASLLNFTCRLIDDEYINKPHFETYLCQMLNL